MIKLAIIAIAAALTATTAMAKDPVPPGNDGFTIFGAVNDWTGYIGVFTLADIDIKNREILVDGAVFGGKAHGLKSKKIVGDDYSGGYVIVKDQNMITAIENGQTMIVFPKKSAAFEVDLTGSKKAIEEARRCNLEQAK